MSFRRIRDQAVALRLLQNMLRRGRVPNGLLFWGLSGVGKRLAALEMAKAINCGAGRGGDACDECLSCRKVEHGNHPDVVITAPARRARIIDLDSVRAITEAASLRPLESAWRVFILQDADRMNVRAQNHFLKTLEEPPGNSLFILVTEYPGMLLPTIRSRCQRVRFGTLRPETVKELLLKERDLPEETAQSIAAVAQGQMSRALDLVDSGRRGVVLDVIGQLDQGGDPLAVAETFAALLAARRKELEARIQAEVDGPDPAEASREDREDFKNQLMALAEAAVRSDIMEYLYLFETWYRDQAVYAATRDANRVFNRDQLSRLEAARPMELDARLAAIEKARVYLERFLNEERVFRDLFFVLAE